MAKVSRRKLARTIADKIIAGESLEHVMQQAAAYLIETNRQGEYDLLARDLEDALVQNGYIVADVTTAEKTDLDFEKTIKALQPNAKKIFIREHIDPTLLGGVKIELPGARFDQSVRTRIDAIKQLAA